MYTVNKLVDSLTEVWSGCEAWIQACNVVKDDYHGGAFEGNECRKLLKNVAKLRSIIPEQFIGYADTLEKIDKVVKACYGTQLLPSYKEDIVDFRNSYLDLGISVTPKVHGVMFHVEEYCSAVGMGLGPWSEQCSEAIHHDFLTVWKNFKIKKMDHKDYGTNLLKAVRMYNGKHV